MRDLTVLDVILLPSLPRSASTSRRHLLAKSRLYEPIIFRPPISGFWSESTLEYTCVEGQGSGRAVTTAPSSQVFVGFEWRSAV